LAHPALGSRHDPLVTLQGPQAPRVPVGLGTLQLLEVHLLSDIAELVHV
jgi:hypothetical protein